MSEPERKGPAELPETRKVYGTQSKVFCLLFFKKVRDAGVGDDGVDQG